MDDASESLSKHAPRAYTNEPDLVGRFSRHMGWAAIFRWPAFINSRP